MNYAPDLTTAAIKMVFALTVVLLMVWGLQRLAKSRLNNSSARSPNSLIQVIGSQHIGVKKSVTMVQVPGSVLVLGVGPDSVRLLTQIEDQEIIKGINEEKASQRELNFKDHLKRLTSLKPMGSLNISKETVVKQK